MNLKKLAEKAAILHMPADRRNQFLIDSVLEQRDQIEKLSNTIEKMADDLEKIKRQSIIINEQNRFLARKTKYKSEPTEESPNGTKLRTSTK